jgi:hypothetical protein
LGKGSGGEITLYLGEVGKDALGAGDFFIASDYRFN